MHIKVLGQYVFLTPLLNNALIHISRILMYSAFYDIFNSVLFNWLKPGSHLNFRPEIPCKNTLLKIDKKYSENNRKDEGRKEGEKENIKKEERKIEKRQQKGE
eukprot:TRINITY_DN23761_c0_g1_i1.p2 TRINITY_DN23761_c0_g1~~TRINITY_DN23761_c0_g1_i1.p2  ORF type:complete len:103 (-),score=7.77 TRINITY_DN23761_c0_g1_i1:36-344(-)